MLVRELKKHLELADDDALVIFEHKGGYEGEDYTIGSTSYHVTGVQHRDYDPEKRERIPGSFVVFSRDPIIFK